MTWVVVVAGLVALAVGVHFAEKAKERRTKAERLARLEKQRRELRFARYREQVIEEWEADFKAMTLRFERHRSGEAPEQARYRLERDAAGRWLMRDAEAGAGDGQGVPARVAEKLEARYQRFLVDFRDDDAPSALGGPAVSADK